MSDETFAPVPNNVLRRRDLSHGAKLCYGRILQYAGKGNKAYPKLSNLADELGMSPRAVQRFVSELEKHCLIRVQQRGRGRSNIYYINSLKVIHRTIPTTTEVACLDTPDLSTLDTPEVSCPYIEKKTLKEN